MGLNPTAVTTITWSELTLIEYLPSFPDIVTWLVPFTWTLAFSTGWPFSLFFTRPVIVFSWAWVMVTISNSKMLIDHLKYRVACANVLILKLIVCLRNVFG